MSARPHIIAVTGGIGSGKTTIANLFKNLGIPVIDSDIVAREIVAPGQPGLDNIIQAFGEGILTEDGTLDRPKLANLVFNDAEKKQTLEKILHPAIYAEIDRQTQSLESPYCLVLIPLLVETGAQHRFDRVLVVDIPDKLQLSRTCERDKLEEDQVKKIMQNQVDRETRLNYADDVLDNSVTIEELTSQVADLNDKYLRLFGDSSNSKSTS